MYRIELSSLRFLYSYLVQPKQTSRWSSSYSMWSKSLFLVLQRSILGPLLFSMFLCDLFLFISNSNIASYTNDNTAHCTGQNIRGNWLPWKHSWIKNNSIKPNPDKYLLDNSKDETYPIKAGNKTIANSKCEKLLGIKSDKELNFNEQAQSL